MERFGDYREMRSFGSKRRVVTIGNFDGVHLGHVALLKAAKQEAKRSGLDLAVLTFEPHPAELLKPDGPKLRLIEPGRKLELLEKNGVDLVLAQRFDRDFSLTEAQSFVSDILCSALGAELVIVGRNFRFGKERSGNVETLEKLGRQYGFEVRVESLVKEGGVEISSSQIRRLLAAGETARVRALLGRCHEVAGRVDRGRGHGAKLGSPTANLTDIQVVVPCAGIYAAYCLTGSAEFGCAVYIGDRPTLGHGFSVEAHLLDFTGDLYDRRVALRFLEKVRGDEKFDRPSALAAQIAKDIEKIRGILVLDRAGS